MSSFFHRAIGMVCLYKLSFSKHMQKHLFILLLATLLFQSAHAQTTPPPVAAAPVEISVGRRDTLAAIGKLYARRRAGGKKWGYVGLGGLLALVRVATAGSSSSSSSSGGGYGAPSTSTSADGGAIALVGGVFVGIPAIIAISKLATFSEQREQQVDRAYRSGQPLPAAVRRRLMKKDFQ